MESTQQQSLRPSNVKCAQAVLETVPMTMQAIRVEMRRSVRTELTVPQFRILARLRQKRSNPCDLADWIGVSVPAISRIAKLLEEKDLVKKNQSRGDRRQFQLHLTPKGRRFFDRCRKVAAEAMIRRLNALNESEKSALLEGLQVLKTLTEVS